MNEEFVNDLPEKFKEIVLSMPHFNGKKWLENLPETINLIEKKWSVKIEKHFPNLSYNYVAPCRFKDGNEAVVKIGLPEEFSEIFDEARVLREFKGEGMIKILDFDKTLEVLLLEKVSPGKSLKEVFKTEKERSGKVAISILKSLLRKPEHNEKFPKLNKWFVDFEKDQKKIKSKFSVEFERASKVLQDFNSDPENQFLLHGDFHHDNILSSARDDFLAIDPNGLIGHVGYDIAVFLNNHAAWIYRENNWEKRLEKLINRFSEVFNISPDEIIKWVYSQQVLSAFWEMEDQIKGWEKSLEFAEIWKRVKF